VPNPTSPLSQVQTQAQAAPALDYPAATGLLDEVRATDGSVKPQWHYLLNSLRDLGPDVLQDRDQKARRILRDDGASYNLYGQEQAPGSAWELDPVPYIIGSEDWARIESGLQERAELLNLMLRDF
jgi:uncharacterized circularly permuted ATP-grasp superfamily protein